MESIDSTTYSRDQKERIPTSWRLKTSALTITIVSGHRFYPGEWVMHCHDVGIDTHPLKMNSALFTALQAQEEALGIVKNKIETMLKSLPGQ